MPQSEKLTQHAHVRDEGIAGTRGHSYFAAKSAVTQLGGSQDKRHLWLERCASVLEFSSAELDSGLESCLCPKAAFRENMRQIASSAALGHIQPLILEDLKVEVSFDMFFGT